MTRNQKILLLGTPALVSVAMALAATVRNSFNALEAITTFILVYWGGCWLLTLLVVPSTSVRSLYRVPFAQNNRARFFTWLPPCLTFVIVFMPSVLLLPARYLLAIALFAIVNGVTEEIFWRGAFNAAWKNSIIFAYFYPCILFATLHVALVFLPGVEYHGGGVALVGGATLMGLLWGWVVWKFRDLRSVTFAHILTNIFAFSGLVLQNWGPRPLA